MSQACYTVDLASRCKLCTILNVGTKGSLGTRITPAIYNIDCLQHATFHLYKNMESSVRKVECTARGRRTSLDGGLQLAQARGHLGIHLPLPRRLLREGVAVGAKRLADLAAA